MESLKYLKRVRKDQEQSRAMFARIEERKKRAQEEQAKERSESQGQKVRILRSYRAGRFRTFASPTPIWCVRCKL